MGDTARKSFVATLVAVAVVASALRALAAAGCSSRCSCSRSSSPRRCGPGVEWLHKRAGPARRSASRSTTSGFLGAIAPAALADRPARARPDQKRARRRSRRRPPTSPPRPSSPRDQARDPRSGSSTGSTGCLTAPASSIPRSPTAARRSRSSSAIFFTFAVAAYWIFEKERAQALVARPRAAEATEGDRGHLGPDRREARRLRARPAA